MKRNSSGDPRWTSHVTPAPGELKIVQAFVNTRVARTHTEELASPRALGHWLVHWRLAPEDVQPTTTDLERAKAVREGVRTLLRANNGLRLNAEALARMDQAAAEIPLRLRAGGEGLVYFTAASSPASDRGSILGRLLGMIAVARFSDAWLRFKACADLPCSSAFFDQTKNQAGCWCSARCSNRIAARNWRRRQQSTGY